MRRMTILRPFFAAVLVILAVVPVCAQRHDEQSPKVAFAKIITDEYLRLLERRISERPKIQNSAKDDVFRALDRQTIEDIRRTVLPEIQSGRVDVVVQSSGLIAVETEDRRIALLAPNQEWDDEFRIRVKWRSKGNQFAISTITESERRMGKSDPEGSFVDRSTLLGSLWHWSCPDGNPSDMYMRFQSDGTVKYGYSQRNTDQYHNARWRLDKKALVLDFNNGYAVDTFPLSEVVNGVFQGSGKTRRGASPIRNINTWNSPFSMWIY